MGLSSSARTRGAKPLVTSGLDSLAADPGERFSLVLANPPFGKKSSFTVVNDEGELEKEDYVYSRQDFWTTTKNKQLNFLQHIYTLLDVPGRAAVVLPDNVLFEGGAGETVRRKLMETCDLHTILRLPTGIFYAQGVKANVLFFDKHRASKTAHTKQVWVYDARTNKHYTLKQNPLRREDFDEFVELFKSGRRHERVATWSEENPEGRWRAFAYEEIIARDKANLDIFWIADKSLESAETDVAPDILAQEIAEELGAAMASFAAVAAELRSASAD
jgi:type I restriction enzyme M protein